MASYQVRTPTTITITPSPSGIINPATTVTIKKAPVAPSSPSSQVRPFKLLTNLSWNRILSEDFCHSKFLQLKWKYVNDSTTPALIQGKQIVVLKDVKKEDRKDSVPQILLDNVGSWAKLSAKVNKYLVEARVWHNGRMRVVIDSPALDEQLNSTLSPYNVFSTLRTDANFDAWKVSLGLNHLSKRCKAMTRLWTDERQNVVLDEKAVVHEGKWIFGTYLRFILNNPRLSRYDGLIGYQEKDYDVYLQHDSDKSLTSVALGALTASLVYRYNSFDLAAQLRHDGKGESYTFGAVYNASKNLKVRASINQNLDLSTAWRYKAHANCSLILGTQWRLSEGANAINFNKTLPFPIGLTIDVSL